MENLTSIEKTAYHLAGHSVAHILLNLFFDSITVTPTPKIQGGLSYCNKTNVRLRLDPSFLLDPQKHLIILYSGCKAVQIKTNNNDDWTGFDVADHDEGSDGSQIKALLEYDFGRFYGLSAADKLLREHWPMVEAVAAALLERKTLRYQEVMDLNGLQD